VLFVVVHTRASHVPQFNVSLSLCWPFPPIGVLSTVRLFILTTPPNRRPPLNVGSPQCVSTHRPGSVLPVQPTCGHTSGLLCPLLDISTSSVHPLCLSSKFRVETFPTKTPFQEHSHCFPQQLHLARSRTSLNFLPHCCFAPQRPFARSLLTFLPRVCSARLNHQIPSSC
jgi:hypothetical protein